jgi:hypothetical protein
MNSLVMLPVAKRAEYSIDASKKNYTAHEKSLRSLNVV